MSGDKAILQLILLFSAASFFFLAVFHPEQWEIGGRSKTYYFFLCLREKHSN